MHNPLVLKYFVDKPMLDIDSPGVATLKTARKRLVSWRILEWVLFENRNQFLSLPLKVASFELFRVFLSLAREDVLETHQLRFLEAFSIPSLLAFWIDSTIPGIECK